MNSQSFIGRIVELSAPDGRIFHFRMVAQLPYAGADYAVLEETGEEGQLLVTHIEWEQEGTPVFVVASEEDIITAVLEKYVAQTIAKAMEQAKETDDDAEI